MKQKIKKTMEVKRLIKEWKIDKNKDARSEEETKKLALE